MPRQLGPIKAHGTAPQLFLNLPFEGGALRATLPESSGNHNRGLHAGIHALSNDLRDRRRRGGNDRQIHMSRDVANARVRFEPQHFRMLRVDGIHFSLRLTVQQVLQNGVAHGARTTGRTDDCHRGWSEHGVQAVSPGLAALFIRRSSHQTSLGRTHSAPHLSILRRRKLPHRRHIDDK